MRCWAGTDDLELVANAVAEVVALRARREADATERPEEDVHDAAAKCLGHRPMPELMTQHLALYYQEADSKHREPEL